MKKNMSNFVVSTVPADGHTHGVSDICNHSEDQVWIPHMYKTGSWQVEMGRFLQLLLLLSTA